MRVTSLFRLVGLISIAVVGFAIVVRAQDVNYNAMPGTDFSKFKTYRWVTVEGAQKPDQITDRMIRNSIDAQLAKKGLKKVDDASANLYVAYQVAINQEKQFNAYGTGGGYYGYRMGGGMGTVTSQTIQVGTLEVDMYDSAAKELVWKGQASKTLDTDADQEKRQKNLDKATEKLLKNYPPPAKKN